MTRYAIQILRKFLNKATKATPKYPHKSPGVAGVKSVTTVPSRQPRALNPYQRAELGLGRRKSHIPALPYNRAYRLPDGTVRGAGKYKGANITGREDAALKRMFGQPDRADAWERAMRMRPDRRINQKQIVEVLKDITRGTPKWGVSPRGNLRKINQQQIWKYLPQRKRTLKQMVDDIMKRLEKSHGLDKLDRWSSR